MACPKHSIQGFDGDDNLITTMTKKISMTNSRLIILLLIYGKLLRISITIKDNPVSYGKDPNALAVATLYAACLKEGEINQLQIATAGDTSIVTLRKKLQD